MATSSYMVTWTTCPLPGTRRLGMSCHLWQMMNKLTSSRPSIRQLMPSPINTIAAKEHGVTTLYLKTSILNKIYYRVTLKRTQKIYDLLTLKPWALVLTKTQSCHLLVPLVKNHPFYMENCLNSKLSFKADDFWPIRLKYGDFVFWSMPGPLVIF